MNDEKIEDANLLPVKIRRVWGCNRNGPKPPAYKHSGDAGMDLPSAVNVSIPPGGRAVIPTGFAIQLPSPQYEAQVRPRSGLAAKHGITVLNSPGTIDFGYTGEIQVILLNTGKDPFVIETGDRIAQLVFARVERASLVPVLDFEETERGDAGLGSTGVK